MIDTYDLMLKYDNYIVGETQIPVRHALLGLPEAELSHIRTVYSHPQGLMQCSQFLNAHRDWEQISLENTAVAAKKVLEDKDTSQAAIASETAGTIIIPAMRPGSSSWEGSRCTGWMRKKSASVLNCPMSADRCITCWAILSMIM